VENWLVLDATVALGLRERLHIVALSPLDQKRLLLICGELRLQKYPRNLDAEQIECPRDKTRLVITKL
jgi:hypothetical protein